MLKVIDSYGTTSVVAVKNGAVFLIDTVDLSLIQDYTWKIERTGKKFYVMGYSPTLGSIYLHRLLLGLRKDDPIQVDHLSGVSVDNRRNNIRRASSVQNAWNLQESRTNKLGVTGVSKVGDRYQARINKNQKRTSLGYFDTIEEASEAYSKAAAEIQRHHMEYQQ